MAGGGGAAATAVPDASVLVVGMSSDLISALRTTGTTGAGAGAVPDVAAADAAAAEDGAGEGEGEGEPEAASPAALPAVLGLGDGEAPASRFSGSPEEPEPDVLGAGAAGGEPGAAAAEEPVTGDGAGEVTPREADAPPSDAPLAPSPRGRAEGIGATVGSGVEAGGT